MSNKVQRNVVDSNATFSVKDGNLNFGANPVAPVSGN